ncbi:MAG: hypothetical protein JSR72_08220 [Proteobacteria bacterium]|nr:hypothetical protein [Pseudomonadota bacterium]
MTKLDSGGTAAATRDDVISILGSLDPEQMLAILELHPTVAELEQASIWLSGDDDVFGVEPPIKGAAAEIVTILSTPEEEED